MQHTPLYQLMYHLGIAGLEWKFRTSFRIGFVGSLLKLPSIRHKKEMTMGTCFLCLSSQLTAKNTSTVTRAQVGPLPLLTASIGSHQSVVENSFALNGIVRHPRRRPLVTLAAGAYHGTVSLSRHFVFRRTSSRQRWIPGAIFHRC